MKNYSLLTMAIAVISSVCWAQLPSEGDPAAKTSEAVLAASLDSLYAPQIATEIRKPKKSVKKAFLLSLVLPGAGEGYIGHDHQSRGFLSAEGVIWGVALFSKLQGEIWKHDYISFAAQTAGSNPDRTDDFYYQNIYEWPNSYWYNENQWREARELYPYDPAAQEAYVSGKLYGENDAWEWGNYEEWYKFRNLRVKSRNALHRISYALGAAVLNRMLSSVNAARLAKRYNKNRLKSASAWEWHFECGTPSPEQLSLTLYGRF
jgi:hypothetical protein